MALDHTSMSIDHFPQTYSGQDARIVGIINPNCVNLEYGLSLRTFCCIGGHSLSYFVHDHDRRSGSQRPGSQ